MASNVTRDHHRWTRDIVVSKSTPFSITLEDALNSTLQIKSDGTASPILELSGQSQESAGSPILNFRTQRDTDTDAQIGDTVGVINFVGYDDGTPGEEYYATIQCVADVVASGEESGKLILQVASHDGGSEDGLVLTGGSVDAEVDVTIGNGAASLTTIAGDLDIDGDTVTTAGAITLDSGSTIILDANDGAVRFLDAGDTDDFAQITVVGGTGYTTLSTISAGDDGHIRLYPDGDLILQPKSGNFISKIPDGTEFSAANSAYAGMILGCTNVFGSGTNGVFQAVTTSWESLLWDTDKYALVTFVVPPSNIVKISVQIPYILASGKQITLGLADDNAANSLGTKYENDIIDTYSNDSFSLDYSWVVEGSDHSWSAGETKTLYIMAYASGATRFYTGGTNSGYYGGVIVEATALPATIGDGSEP